MLSLLGVDRIRLLTNNPDKVASLNSDQLRRIAERKMPDLNANDVDMAMRIVAGTARSMGVEVEA